MDRCWQRWPGLTKLDNSFLVLPLTADEEEVRGVSYVVMLEHRTIVHTDKRERQTFGVGMMY